METKSLIVGVLIGVCICLGAVFVLGQGVETAHAGPVPAGGRYQITASDPNWGYNALVLDQETGSVYMLMSASAAERWDRIRGKADNPAFQAVWRKRLDGPPSR